MAKIISEITAEEGSRYVFSELQRRFACDGINIITYLYYIEAIFPIQIQKKNHYSSKKL